MKTVTYKGYQASVEFEDDTLFIKVLHIDDVLVAECDSASEVKKAAEELIDAYIEDCAQAGREPAKPFKGSFNVRVTPQLHRHAAMRATQEGMSLNSWIASAIQDKLECSRLTDRLDGVVERSHLNIEQAAFSLALRISERDNREQIPGNSFGQFTAHGQWVDDRNPYLRETNIVSIAGHSRMKLHG